MDHLQNKSTIIIAEAGVNHNGSIENAKKLVDVAVKAGADYVKFQTFKAKNLVSKLAIKADYQKINLKDGVDTQYEMLKKLELSDQNHKELIEYCSRKKIRFFSTAFDVEGLKYLNSLNFDFFKIPSGEITNYQYLKTIASFNKPVILSTGMSTIQEIEDALKIIKLYKIENHQIVILHCNTEYPTPYEDVNLNAMLSMKNKFGVNVGYSDHTLGIEVPIAAVAMGAKVIEKHFTLDRNMYGPDHAASLEPSELIEMVKSIRNTELALSGNGIKLPSKSEIKNKSIARKSIHIANKVFKGGLIDEKHFISLRPGDGISPMRIPQIIGKKFSRDLNQYDKLELSDFE